MKVGILTYHRANNFGAVLQCYALQSCLEACAYQVEVIDYRQPFTELAYKAVRWDIMRDAINKPRLMAGYLVKVLPEKLKRANKYNKFRNAYLKTSKVVKCANDMPQDIDVFLIGSDQMWSLHCTGYTIDKIYFGEFPHHKNCKICGYAISSNIQSLEQIGSEALTYYTNNFKILSFREEIIRDTVEKMTQIHGRVDLDPSLLVDADVWQKLAAPRIVKQKYCLTYFLHDIDNEKEFNKHINTFAQKRGCIVVDMFDIAFSPSAFLSAIMYADCVISTSFHATAFSVLFKKDFYSLTTNNGKDIRYINLLTALGIPERVVGVNELVMFHSEKINYRKVYANLNTLREQSKNYLKELANL